MTPLLAFAGSWIRQPPRRFFSGYIGGGYAHTDPRDLRISLVASLFNLSHLAERLYVMATSRVPNRYIKRADLVALLDRLSLGCYCIKVEPLNCCA
jgi:hypothetical protein